MTMRSVNEVTVLDYDPTTGRPVWLFMGDSYIAVDSLSQYERDCIELGDSAAYALYNRAVHAAQKG